MKWLLITIWLMVNQISPQEGFQKAFLSSPADIVIGGSGAGVGKSFALLLEPARYSENKLFEAVIFRRTTVQIRNAGGLWDESQNIYSLIGANPKETFLTWTFKSGAKVKFAHLEHEKNKYDWQGSQIAMIGFDELTHFSKSQFFYLLSRNRSMCGIRPYVRATCNPDPDSWVSDIIEWWIEQDDESPNYGYPIKDRVGKLRWFTRHNDDFIWGNTFEEVYEKAEHIFKPIIEATGANPKELIKSITFIPGDIYDNKKLLEKDPGYLANLHALDHDEQLRLLKSNWKIKIGGKDLYNYIKFKDIFTNSHVQEGVNRYITSDIALKGSDKFVVFVWYGRVIVDAIVMDKSNGKEVIKAIERMKNDHQIPNSNISFDNDGVGAFVDGFIEGAVEFINNARAKNDEMYQNLKTQCFYKSADAVQLGKIHIVPHVANIMYDDKMTIKQRLEYERKAIKRDKTDSDGKLHINKKEDQKLMLDGQSPDLMDAFSQREIFDLTQTITFETTESASDLGF